MNNTGKYIIGFIALLLTGIIAWYFSSIISYILIAAVISFLGRPVINFLSRLKLRNFALSNSFKAAVTLFVIWLFVILFFGTVIPLVSKEFMSLRDVNVIKIVDGLKDPINDVGRFLHRYGLVENSTDMINYISNYLSSLFNFGKLGNLFGSVAGTLSSLAVALFSISFIAFFFLKDSELFTEIIVVIFPAKYEDGIRKSLDSIQELIGRYFVGIVIEVLGVMFLNTMGLWIVGLSFPNALVIGLATGVLNVIPYIGPLIGMILGLTIGTILNINMEFYGTLLPLLVSMQLVFMFTQLVDNIIFQPLIYGNSVYAHPLEIFLVILLAGNMAGIPGMILAIPSYTVIRVILKEFFSKYKLVKKITQSMDHHHPHAHHGHHENDEPKA